VDHLLTEVEVVCLPRYLPEFLEIDVTELALNQIYHLSDIKLPEGVALVALKHGDNRPLVAVNPPREEEIDAPVETAEVPAGEVPATAQAVPEAGAEGGEEKEKEKEASAGGKDKDKEAKKPDKKEKG